MAIIAAILQFVQTKMLMAKRPPKKIRKDSGARDEDMMAQMNKSMLYFMPVMTAVIGASLPGGLTLYWIVMNIFAILQQALTFRKKSTGVAAESK
jgi:YidC/Oxa1 family membrane protein insertase